MNDETIAQRMLAAKQMHAQKARAARAAALSRFKKCEERRRQIKIAGSMLALLALIMANAWAAAHGWGLQ